MKNAFCQNVYKFSSLLIMGVAVFSLCSLSTKCIKRTDTSLDSLDKRIKLDPRFALGYGSFLSVVVWVDAIGEYANVLFDGGSGRNFGAKIEQVSLLDQDWSYPLLFGAYAIPDLPGRTELDAVPLLQRGVLLFPDEWEFRLVWAEYLLNGSDSLLMRDSAIRVLLPLTSNNEEIPESARYLALILLHSSGRPDQAMEYLVRSYFQVYDPIVRLQFHRKIGDLLWRNRVHLASDSDAIVTGICSMLDSDSAQAATAKDLLIRLVQPETKDAAILEARHLARQFRAYQSAQVGASQ